MFATSSYQQDATVGHLLWSTKTYFNQKVNTWLKSHPRRVVTHFQNGLLFSKVDGFEQVTLWSIDPNIFPCYLFEPAEHQQTRGLDNNVRTNAGFSFQWYGTCQLKNQFV